jgi:4-hydroxy-tetrahydrodipicolinate reductase
MNDLHKKRYRVAQWGTGNVGMRSLRKVIEHPQYDLVGVYVYSDAKVGRDAGDLCGTEKTGVIATRNIDDILAAKPDCVLHMADRVELEVICRLLESGINIVSTRAEFHERDSLDPALREPIEAACQKGGTSLHSTGSSPGMSTEVLPFALTSMQRRLDCFTLEECADISSRNSPEMIFGGLRFGSHPSTVDEARRAAVVTNAKPTMLMTAAALGVPLDEIVGSIEYAVATQRVEIAAGVIEAGTIAAQRTAIDGMRNGKPLFKRRGTMFATRDIDPAWELRKGWHILVEGDAPVEISWSYPVPEEEWAEFTPGLTAHRPVNAVPYVCEAPPGIRTTAMLPLILANFGP